MLVVLAHITATASRRFTQAGVLLGFVGAVVLVLGTLPFMKKFGLLLGGLLLAAAFLLIGIAVHWGLSPYIPKK
jgi:hypothetical protein